MEGEIKGKYENVPVLTLMVDGKQNIICSIEFDLNDPGLLVPMKQVGETNERRMLVKSRNQQILLKLMNNKLLNKNVPECKENKRPCMSENQQEKKKKQITETVFELSHKICLKCLKKY